MREQETAFIGKITAGVTHEFMNVLATIRENSGLMEDLLALCRETSFPHREKFAKTLITIQKQVNRGMEISARLNNFAHSMDEPKARVELHELLDQLTFLVQRFARLKQVQLTVNPVEPPLAICIDLFRLQLILVACVEYCLDHTASGGVITLQSQRTSQGIAIQSVTELASSLTENADTLPDELAGLQEALEGLGARLIPLSTPGQQGLELILPLNNE
jgi:C4-dicarboxylate-specific signal transduction histidine kinase